MPGYDDENFSLTSSKKFGSIGFRRSGVSSKRKSELKAAISGPHTFDGGGVSTVLGDAPLRSLNDTRSPHPSSVSTVLNGSSSPPQKYVGGIRRNSDAPLRRHYSSLAWPSNHPTISSVHGSHHRTRATHSKPRKVDISKPLALDSSHFSSTSGIYPKRSPHSTQIDSGSRWSGTMATAVLKGNPNELTSPGLSYSHKQRWGSNPLDVLSDEFDPRTMMESLPALNMDLSTSGVSFGSVKQRTGGVSKALRTSRTMPFLVPEKAQPDLVYTDDSDSFSSPPSTPSTPVWETTVTSSMLKTDPKPTSKLELADVHTQIQEMIDSANRPFSTESGNNLGEDRELPSTPRNDIPLSLRPSNPTRRSFPRLAATHKRCVSSPPPGSEIYPVCPPDFHDRLLYRSVTPGVPHKPAPPASSPLETTPKSLASSTSMDIITPSTPTKNTSSERSDSPSVYSQPSPSSQIGDVTPTSSNPSSPDHPYTKNKHERLLAAISEGISSPTRPRPTAPLILGSGRGRTNDTYLAASPPDAETPAVPVIVVTDPNDDDLVYSESGFSIVDMYTGLADSSEVGLGRRRTRTAHSVSCVSPSRIERVLITIQHRSRHAFDTPTLRNSVSLNSPRLSQTTKERSSPYQEPLKKRASIFCPSLPSSFLSMSTLHEVEVAEATSTPRDRKSFYAAVGLKGLFRRSGSKGLPLGQSQTQASGAVGVTGGGGGAQPGSTSLVVPNAEAGDDVFKGGWGLFKWKR